MEGQKRINRDDHYVHTVGIFVTIPLKMKNNLLQTNSVAGHNGRLEKYEFAVHDSAHGAIHVKGGIFDKKNVVWH